MREAHGSTAFEGKVGVLSLGGEVAMLREIRQAIGEDAVLRVDTNNMWSVTTAREAVRRFAPFNIRNYEDPVDTYEELARLRPYTDASFSTHNPDLRRAALMPVPDYFCLNLSELGGIRRTVEFIKAAHTFGRGAWFHSGESSIGTAAYLHVAAA